LLIATQFAAHHDSKFAASDAMAATTERVEQHIETPGMDSARRLRHEYPGVKAASRACFHASAAAIERSANGSRRFAKRASGRRPRWLARPMEALKTFTPSEPLVILQCTHRAAKQREYAARISDPEFPRSFGETRIRQPSSALRDRASYAAFPAQVGVHASRQVSAEFCVKQ
jgi:hypothetical protein